MKFPLMILFILTGLALKAQDNKADSVRQAADSGITREASFPGGDKAWALFLKKTISKNIKALVEDDRSGKCILRFVINEDGSIGFVLALTMRDSELARVSIDAISKGPRWIPAMKNGRYVKATREEPISFTISSPSR
jgi:protein TonB